MKKLFMIVFACSTLLSCGENTSLSTHTTIKLYSGGELIGEYKNIIESVQWASTRVIEFTTADGKKYRWGGDYLIEY